MIGWKREIGGKKMLIKKAIDKENMIGIDDPETILRPLANQLRPTIISSWMEKKKALLTNNAERMKRLLDNLQKKLDEV